MLDDFDTSTNGLRDKIAIAIFQALDEFKYYVIPAERKNLANGISLQVENTLRGIKQQFWASSIGDYIDNQIGSYNIFLEDLPKVKSAIRQATNEATEGKVVFN